MVRLDNGHAISAVPRAYLGEARDYTDEFLEKALEHSVGYNVEDVLKRLNEGSAVLWLIEKDMVVQGIVVTEIVCYPRCKSLNIWLTAGENIKEWEECFSALEMYARHQECEFIETGCRLGLEPVLKRLGFNIRRIAALKRVDKGTH